MFVDSIESDVHVIADFIAFDRAIAKLGVRFVLQVIDAVQIVLKSHEKRAKSVREQGSKSRLQLFELPNHSSGL